MVVTQGISSRPFVASRFCDRYNQQTFDDMRCEEVLAKMLEAGFVVSSRVIWFASLVDFVVQPLQKQHHCAMPVQLQLACQCAD